MKFKWSHDMLNKYLECHVGFSQSVSRLLQRGHNFFSRKNIHMTNEIEYGKITCTNIFMINAS